MGRVVCFVLSTYHSSIHTRMKSEQCGFTNVFTSAETARQGKLGRSCFRHQSHLESKTHCGNCPCIVHSASRFNHWLHIKLAM